MEGKGEEVRRFSKEGERYKLFWKGCNGNSEGVGVFAAEKWEKEVVAVNRINERMMSVRIKVGERTITIFSVYAPQAGRKVDEKENF